MKIQSKISILLASLLLVTSCQNADEKKTSTDDTKVEEASEENKEASEDNKDSEDKDLAKGDVPTLIYYNVGTPQVATDDVADALNEYLDSQDAGYHIAFQYFDWGDYQQKLQLASNAGDDWDLAFTASWAGPYKEMIDKGAFLDITDLAKEKGQAMLDLVSDDVLKGASVDGRLYGAPATADNITPADFFIWNKDLVEKYDIPIEDIKEEKDLEPYLKEVKENEAEVEYPFGIANDFIFQTRVPTSTAAPGVGVREEDGKLVAYSVWEDDGYKDLAYTMKKYMDAGYIDPSAPQIDAGQLTNGPTWLVRKGEGGVKSDDIWTKNFGVPVVSSYAGDMVYVTNEKATGSLLAINSQSEYPELAMDFINRMYSDKVLMRYLVNGIEGVNYNLVDDAIEPIEDTGYDVPGFTFLASQMMTPSVKAEKEDKAEREALLETYLERVKPSPILGFNFDKAGSEKEYENVYQIIEQYLRNIKTGAFDDAYYEEFVEKLHTAGIEKLVEEVQKQLDSWEDK